MIPTVSNDSDVTFQEINEIITLEGENLMYIPLKFDNDIRRKALVDTGACANAMPADFYEKLKKQSPESISELQQASLLNVKVASGKTVKVLAQIDVKFKVNNHEFQAAFLNITSNVSMSSFTHIIDALQNLS